MKMSTAIVIIRTMRRQTRTLFPYSCNTNTKDTREYGAEDLAKLGHVTQRRTHPHRERLGSKTTFILAAYSLSLSNHMHGANFCVLRFVRDSDDTLLTMYFPSGSPP